MIMDAPIVTLTTDWGDRGFFSGMVKGTLYSRIGGVRVVDIDLGIEPFNKLQTTFIVRHACPTFPEGTIHIIDVASTPMPLTPFVVIRARGQYYICCDNGIPAAALGPSVDEAYELVLPGDGFYNFAAYDLFAPVAAAIAGGTPIHELGPLRKQLNMMYQPTYSSIEPDVSYNVYVHYIDIYGNAYLGMTYDEFCSLRGNREFTLQVRDKQFKKIHSTYHTGDPNKSSDGELCLTVSATGLLEVAICNMSFNNLVGVKIGDNAVLTFNEKSSK